MIRTLYAKLSVALVAIVLAIAALYAVLTLFATRHHLQVTEQRLNHDLARDLVADRNLVEEGRINEAALREMFHDYMTINPSIEIYLIDLKGRILSFSADPGVVKRKRVSLGPIRAFLAGDDAYPLLGDDPRSHDGQKAFSVTPVPSAENPDGYLYVVLLGERVDSIAALLHTSFIAQLQRAGPDREHRDGVAGGACGIACDDPQVAPPHQPHRSIPRGRLPNLRAVRGGGGGRW